MFNAVHHKGCRVVCRAVATAPAADAVAEAGFRSINVIATEKAIRTTGALHPAALGD